MHDEKKVRWYDKIEKTLIVMLFLIMLAILFVNVITRFCFSYTASWSEQAARIAFVWMSFAGVSLAGMYGSHLQVTVASMILGEKRARFVFWIGDIVVILFGLFMAWKIFEVMQTVIMTKQAFPAIPWLPSWILYLPGVAGMLGLSIRVIQNRYRNIVNSRKEDSVR